MKRIFKHLIFTVAFALMLLSNADARSAKALMAQLDLEGFNEEQKAMIEEEVEDYTSEIDYLYETNKEEYKKKINELLIKLRDGFRVYKIARHPDIKERILRFDSLNTGVKVYVFAYVEGAFLNNLFQRLSESFYSTVNSNRYIKLKYSFKQAPTYTEDKPIFLPAPEVVVADDVLEKIEIKLTQLNLVALNEYTNRSTGYELTFSDAVGDYQKHTNQSVDSVLDLLGGSEIATVPYYYFIDPAGNAFVLQPTSGLKVIAAIKNGPLISFQLDGKVYDANWSESKFKGYFSNGEQFTQEFFSPGGYMNEKGQLKSKIFFIKDFVDAKSADLEADAILGYIEAWYFEDGEVKYFTNENQTQRYAGADSYPTGGKEYNLFASPILDLPNKTEYTIKLTFTKGKVETVTDDLAGKSITIIKNKNYKVNREKNDDKSSKELELATKYKDVKVPEGTAVSFYEDGYLITKNGNDVSVEAKSADEIKLIKERIDKGEIAEKSEIFYEIKTDKNGKKTCTVGALGYRKDLQPNATRQDSGFKWSESDRVAMQKYQKEKFNEYLSDKKVDDLMKVDPRQESRGSFPDGEKTIVKECTFYEKFLKITRETSDFIENCEIPERFWNPALGEDYDQCIINTSPYFSGVGNGVIDEAKSIPQLIIMGTEMALDAEKREQVINSFVELAKNPDKILTGIINAGKQMVSDFIGTSPESWHAKGKGTVQIMSIFMGGFFSKTDDLIKKGGDNALENFTNVNKNLDYMNGPFGKVFGKLKKKIETLDKPDRDLLKADLENNKSTFLARLDELPEAEGAKLIDAWKLAKKHEKIRANPQALERVNDIVSRGRGIDADKLKAALDGDLGDILAKADNTNLNKILDRLDQPHVDGKYFDDLTSRFSNPDYGKSLKQDLMENPSWFETYDDILQDPGKYWDIIKDTDIPTNSALSKWGNGKWFKEVTALGKKFEDLVRSKLLTKSSDLYIGLKNQLSAKGLKLEQYDFFEQIQMKYLNEDFFIGDFVLVRKEFNAITNQFKLKAVVVEVKLKNSTGFTIPQTNAINKLQSGDKNLITRSSDKASFSNRNISLLNGSKIEVEDFIKVWSDGTGDNFSNLQSLF